MPKPTTSNEEADIRRELRETRRQMRELGVKRVSCFNGGHSPDSYRLNSRMFELETMLRRARAASATA